MPKNSGLREKDIQFAILSYLQAKHYFHWRNNSGAFKAEHGSFIRFGAVGSPDIFLIKEGVLFGLEVKTPDGVLSDYQKSFGEGMVKAGAKYHIVTSIDDVQALGL